MQFKIPDLGQQFIFTEAAYQTLLTLIRKNANTLRLANLTISIPPVNVVNLHSRVSKMSSLNLHNFYMIYILAQKYYAYKLDYTRLSLM